jgi:hypothetical protein
MARGEYTPPLPEPVQIIEPPLPEPERTASGRLVYAERKKSLLRPAGWKGEPELPFADITESQPSQTSNDSENEQISIAAGESTSGHANRDNLAQSGDVVARRPTHIRLTEASEVAIDEFPEG